MSYAGLYDACGRVADAIDKHTGLGVNEYGCVCGWENPEGTDRAQLRHAAEQALAPVVETLRGAAQAERVRFQQQKNHSAAAQERALRIVNAFEDSADLIAPAEEADRDRP